MSIFYSRKLLRVFLDSPSYKLQYMGTHFSIYLSRVSQMVPGEFPLLPLATYTVTCDINMSEGKMLQRKK